MRSPQLLGDRTQQTARLLNELTHFLRVNRSEPREDVSVTRLDQRQQALNQVRDLEGCGFGRLRVNHEDQFTFEQQEREDLN